MTNRKLLLAAAAWAGVMLLWWVGQAIYIIAVPYAEDPSWDAPARGAGITILFSPVLFLVLFFVALAGGHALRRLHLIRRGAIALATLTISGVIGAGIAHLVEGGAWEKAVTFSWVSGSALLVLGSSAYAWWWTVSRRSKATVESGTASAASNV